MFLIDERLLFGLLVMIQISGIITLLATRFGQIPNRQAWNLLFFALLIAVGGMTVWEVMIDRGDWLPCGATFAVMTVGATVDSGLKRGANPNPI